MRWNTLVLAAVLLMPPPAAGQIRTREALSALVGHSRAELIQRFGPPSDTVTTVDGERLFYETLDAGQVGPRAALSTRAGGPGDVGPSPRTYSFRCRTEVVIRDGRVQAFNRSGNDCH